MKKSLKCLVAATASVISTGAIAATNMENPLYMPQNREVYVKTAVALMYKTVEGTAATDKKGTSGQEEFPTLNFVFEHTDVIVQRWFTSFHLSPSFISVKRVSPTRYYSSRAYNHTGATGATGAEAFVITWI